MGPLEPWSLRRTAPLAIPTGGGPAELTLLYPAATYHDAGADGDASAAVRVRHYVTEPHAEEGDGYQPHGVQQVGMVFVVEPVETNLNNRGATWRAAQLTP